MSTLCLRRTNTDGRYIIYINFNIWVFKANCSIWNRYAALPQFIPSFRLMVYNSAKRVISPMSSRIEKSRRRLIGAVEITTYIKCRRPALPLFEATRRLIVRMSIFNSSGQVYKIPHRHFKSFLIDYLVFRTIILDPIFEI